MTDPNRLSFSRRNCLKAIGASSLPIAASSATVGATRRSSEGDLDRVHSQARKIREKTGSHENYLKHLANAGFAQERKWGRTTIPMEEDNSSGPSTQDLAENRIYHEINLNYACEDREMYVEYFWEHEVCHDNLVYGESPRDVGAIHWQNDDYSYLKDTKYTSSHTYLDEYNGDINTHGLAAEYDDEDATDELGYTCGDTIFGFVGGKVYISNIDDPPRAKAINGDYYHHYTSTTCGISSVGLSSAGALSISFSCDESVDSWRVQEYEDEESAGESCCPDCTY